MPLLVRAIRNVRRSLSIRPSVKLSVNRSSVCYSLRLLDLSGLDTLQRSAAATDIHAPTSSPKLAGPETGGVRRFRLSYGASSV